MCIQPGIYCAWGDCQHRGAKLGSSRSITGIVLTVDVTAMSYVEDYHRSFLVIYAVDHAIIPYPDAPTFTIAQLQAAARSRVLSKGANGIAHALITPAR